MATAQGDVKFLGKTAAKTVCLLTGIIATNGQPSTPNDGVPVYETDNSSTTGDVNAAVSYMSRASREGSLVLKGVASGGTASVTARLWGYHAALGQWVPMGAGADTTKGVINAGAAMGPTKTNTVLHAEPVLLLGMFDRVYLEITAISGTSMTVEAWLTTARTVAY